MKVLVVAAHPDDEILGVGGTVLRHRAAGDEVRLTCWYWCRQGPPESVEFIPKLYPDRHKGSVLEMIVGSWQPEIVYTHHDGDINADHRALAEAVLVACRPYAAPSVRSLRMFETPSSTEWGAPFVPNLFVDIEKTVLDKIDSLYEHYESEMRPAPHPRSSEMLKARAKFWGQQAGFVYAEPFRVVRERW